MSELERRLADNRAARNAARAAHDANLAQVKADLAARSIGGRIADKARDDALDLASETVAVARESKGIIAGAIGALTLWFLRDQVAALVARLLKPAAVQDQAARQDEPESFEEPAE